MGSDAADMRLGCFLLRPPGVEEALRRFEHAETLGYDSAWATHVNGHDSFVLMAGAAVRTERIRIGVGVVPIYSRTPATMAQTARTLWELSGGRTELGIGLSHKIVVEGWHGQSIDHPAAEMREYLTVVRSILDGLAPPEAGAKWVTNMSLIQFEPAPEVPLLVGALAPAMLRTAGELADGVILWMCNPDYIADVVVPEVAKGRERAGKSMEGFQIVPSIPCGPTTDAPKMREEYAKQVVHNLRLPFYRKVLERGGYTDTLAILDEVDSFEALFRPVEPEVLGRLGETRFVNDIAAIGSEDEIAAKLDEYERAGATTAGINPVLINDFDATLERAASAHARGRRAGQEQI
jgi:alkanesulfonate monooxygenase SsuD/methylene tetrahydromethanopterin reductase-like flavin-dependent oxidoreductase (luciferase family)